jgi:hypothetical protein
MSKSNKRHPKKIGNATHPRDKDYVGKGFDERSCKPPAHGGGRPWLALR